MKRKVYTQLKPGAGPLFRVFNRSWSARGWEVRIGTRTGLDDIDTRVNVINFSYRPGDPRPRAVKYGKPGWETAALVIFQTEDQVLNCGRPIC